MKPLISTLALLSLLVTSAVYAGPGAAADSKAAADVKAAAAGDDSWFGKMAREQQTNFDITRRLHAFVLAQAQYQVSGEASEKISSCAYQVLSSLHLESPFPRPLANIIGAYATAARSIDIDWLLVKISQSDLKPLMEQQIKSTEDTVTATLKANPQKFRNFRAIQRRDRVTYPLSLTEIQRWEDAGFVLRPMLAKRDRMVCDHCQEVVLQPAAPNGSQQAPKTTTRGVSGMLYVNSNYSDSRSYLEPADYHKYSKPHPEHLAELQAQAIQNPAVCENMPDPKTPEFLRHVLRHVHLRAWTIARLPANQLPPDISADLYAASMLWIYFNSACTQMMGWSIAARYFDDPRPASLDPILQYSKLENAIMQVPKA